MNEPTGEVPIQQKMYPFVGEVSRDVIAFVDANLAQQFRRAAGRGDRLPAPTVDSIFGAYFALPEEVQYAVKGIVTQRLELEKDAKRDIQSITDPDKSRKGKPDMDELEEVEGHFARLRKENIDRLTKLQKGQSSGQSVDLIAMYENLVDIVGKIKKAPEDMVAQEKPLTTTIVDVWLKSNRGVDNPPVFNRPASASGQAEPRVDK